MSTRPEKYRPTLWSAQRLYRPYVRWALAVALTLGFSTGTSMLLLPALGLPVGGAWVTHTQAHGVAQIFGWAGLFLMGVSFHVVPRFRNGPIAFPRPQRAVLTLVLLGIGLRFTGQTFSSLGVSFVLLAASGVSLALGIGLFALVIGQALRRGTAPHSPSESWLWMSLLWSVVAAGLHLAIVAQMASDHRLTAPYLSNNAFVYAALVGFIVNFILGVSLRAVPAFLALPPSRLRLGRLAFLSVNAGVALTTVAWLLGPMSWLLAIGALLELVGFAAFTAAIRLYSPRISPRAYTLETYGRYEWYVKSAYVWLLVSGLLQAWGALGNLWPAVGPPTNLAAPALHALALGFVTMIIMGMAARMIPLFEGATLPLHGLMDAAFIFINASVLLRLGFGIVPSGAALAGLALSGVLGTLALVCCAVVMWRTLQPASRRRHEAMALAFDQQRLTTHIHRQQSQGNLEGDGSV